MSCHTKPTQRKYRGLQGSGPRRREGTQDTKRSNNILRPARDLRVGHHQAPHRRSSQIKLSASPERGRGVRVLALVMCASVVRRSGRRLGGRSTASSSMCSNRVATRVNDLKAWEKRHRGNTRFCSDFANSGKAQQSVAPPLHGGGQGFESPRLHLQKCRFAGQTSQANRNSGAHPGTRSATHYCRVSSMAQFVPSVPCSRGREIQCALNPGVLRDKERTVHTTLWITQ
jgi:hypothetical protein